MAAAPACEAPEASRGCSDGTWVRITGSQRTEQGASNGPLPTHVLPTQPTNLGMHTNGYGPARTDACR